MAFGLGGITQNNQKSASDVFSFTSDVFQPIFDINELVERYKKTLKKIKIASPSKFKPVMELVSLYASHEAKKYE